MAMAAWTAKILAFCSMPGAKQVAVIWMETAQWTALTLGACSLLGDHDYKAAPHAHEERAVRSD
jgi:hypothetical protein